MGRIVSKTVLKSLRLSDRGYGIDSQPGDNFSAKFDALVQELIDGETERRAKLQSLDRQIVASMDHLAQIKQNLSMLDQIIHNVEWVSNSLSRVVQQIERVSHEKAPPPEDSS